MTTIYDFSAEKLEGDTQALSDYSGKVVLIVNTASKCGFTPQFEGLEKVYEKYKDQGFVVLGFPCNQFASQDPGSNTDIGEFCQRNYGVSFPMFAKIDVNGGNAHPLYKYLTKEAKGLLGTEAVKWNFTKFLVGRDGNVIDRYATATKPEAMVKDIEKALSK
ncbi:MAG: glutathione peroxidase [Moraxellaceae bacterium]|nr:MAG: glutathione peroxidase [Moraxellaceae bacterium]